MHPATEGRICYGVARYYAKASTLAIQAKQMLITSHQTTGRFRNGCIRSHRDFPFAKNIYDLFSKVAYRNSKQQF